jgi:hypothetical protein
MGVQNQSVCHLGGCGAGGDPTEDDEKKELSREKNSEQI